MKWFARLMLVADLLLVAACSNSGTEPAQEDTGSGQEVVTEPDGQTPDNEATPEPGTPDGTEDTNTGQAAILTLDQVQQAIQAQGLELTAASQENDWVLNDVEPQRNTLNGSADQPENNEIVTIYVFDSEQARQEGLANFNEQTANLPIKKPAAIEHKNVLILYWYNAEETDNPATLDTAVQLDHALKAL
ncbi:hypothetical protein [Paenibacillus massiliensis]|uniref:hypothetical protein n=1 Tax=Paenibacillus massiliensis TaxID=225917 RepID=UPI0003736522|nr:hypothetical protein [Paenibacillus massiliensis]